MNRTDEEILGCLPDYVKYTNGEKTSIIVGFRLAEKESEKEIERLTHERDVAIKNDAYRTELSVASRERDEAEMERLLAIIKRDEKNAEAVIQQKEKEIESLRKELEQAKKHQTIIQMSTVLGNIPHSEADDIINSLAELREVVKLANESEQHEMIGFPASVADYAKREIVSLRTRLNELVEGLEKAKKHYSLRFGVFIKLETIQQLIQKAKEGL